LAPIFAYLTQRSFIKIHTKLRVSTILSHHHPSSPAMGLTQPRMRWLLRSFSEVKRPGRGAKDPLPSNYDVKERVNLYFYSSLCLHGRLQGELYLC